MLLRKAFFAFLPLNLCILIHLTTSEFCTKLENTSTVLQANRAQFLSIADGAEKFGLELFTLISTDATDNDFVISPFSVWALLLLLVEAASENTLVELNTALRINQDRQALRQAFNVVQQFLLHKTSTIQVENLQAMYYDTYEKVSPDYIRTLTTCYNAKAQNLNFNDTKIAVNFINNAIKTETKGLISDAITADDVKNARLLLTSTLYFKGQWQFPFNRSDTRREIFYDMNGKPVGEVEMMFQMTPFNYTRIQDLQAHVLELPYGNENRLCMLAILPNKGISVNQVAQNLRKFGVRPIFNKIEEDALNYGEQDVEVYLPRLETTSTLSLRGTLEAMGIKSIFDPQTVNLLSQTSFVKDVIQSTKIIVNEEGTEAAAVVAAILTNKISPPKFYFNRPFMYLIAEKRSNTLLFAGQLSTPKLS
nr:serine protease inhibitor 77Ba [Bactrocera oleae]XP_036214158.1 serine protease inhibitor 77Ba [Bactrocera oleae]XP_036214159.1 serine protease inhibitor 77Ba [Bactrocera oleae]XP_036214160.1 serine protease inhibitor 77Ba [Bactrocera oleae]XP_036214161.1 serine protease inhibitor 77Ba [Bactrocera oleae]XP_036214162.1 serine protease inhibitor 77Ba [Bactrocera oleae]